MVPGLCSGVESCGIRLGAIEKEIGEWMSAEYGRLNLMVQASLADIDSSQKLLRSCLFASTLFKRKELASIIYA